MELTCVAQTYDWGRTGLDSCVARLVASGEHAVVDPQRRYAELWMGTHQNGASKLRHTEGEHRLLSAFINDNEQVLGSAVLRKFGSSLPFLFKVLSVNKALSIQAHPTKSHAEQLHSQRPDIYKDDNHKPEVAIALTEFEALCGFRPLAQIQRFMANVEEFRCMMSRASVDNFLAASASNYVAQLKTCFTEMMLQSPDIVASSLRKLVTRLRNTQTESYLPAELIVRLYTEYPDDVGCFSVFFFNHVILQPAEALFLAPNQPHAYLRGDCVECMACSDNVVRAGLTGKLKDVDTLVHMLDYTCSEARDRLLVPVQESPSVCLYRTCVEEFAVARIHLLKDNTETLDEGCFTLPVRQSASIVLCMLGDCTTHTNTHTSHTQHHHMRPGTVLFLNCSDMLTLHVTAGTEYLLFQAFCNVF